jgi:hypothetical protein
MNNSNNSNKKFMRENVLFILILNYENIYKCFECIHDLINRLKKLFNFQTNAIKKIIDKIGSNGSNKETLEKDIVGLLQQIA